MSDLNELVEEFTATLDPEVKSELFLTLFKEWDTWNILKLGNFKTGR